MDRKTPELMIDPDDSEEPAPRSASDDGVVHHAPPSLRGFNPQWVVQSLLHLSADDPAFWMIPLQVADVRLVPNHWPIVHPYIEYRPHVRHSPYTSAIRRATWRSSEKTRADPGASCESQHAIVCEEQAWLPESRSARAPRHRVRLARADVLCAGPRRSARRDRPAAHRTRMQALAAVWHVRGVDAF